MTKKIRKAVFPVGGLGTRFLPATKSMPKEMLPVVDKPLIHYAFEEAKEAGIEQFIFVTGRNKTAITNHFDSSYELERILSEKNKAHELDQTKGWMPEPGNIIFTRQQEPLGLGHAIWCARHLIEGEPFAVLLADDLVLSRKSALQQMVEVFEETGGNVVALQDVPRSETRNYGVIDPVDPSAPGPVYKTKGMVEKPKPEDAPSTLSVIGRYIIQPDIFDYISLSNKGAGGEIQLTDALSRMMETTPLTGVLIDGKRYDCGSKAGFIEANIAFALARDDLRDHVREAMKQMLEEGVPA